jgi:ribonuclease BN (tRNA processing enzyme)
MKITFLGVSGALSAKYNSNMLIENDKDCMLFDCGEDVMHSLNAAGRKPEELTDVFISHLHYDHMGGLSWLGYYTYFVMKKRLTMYIHESMISDIWAMLRPAMEKLDGMAEMMSLDDYFNIVPFKDNDSCVVGSFYFEPVKQLHVATPQGNMYSYGAIFKHSTLEGKCWIALNSGEAKVLITSDTKSLHIPLGVFPTMIFCDVDVMNLGGVHPNYDVLKAMPSGIKENMWLYHYHDFHDIGMDVPNYEKDGFAGFVEEGQVFEI